MNDIFNFHIDYSIIITILIFSATISIILCVYLSTKSRSGKVLVFFIVGCILTIIWTVFNILEILAPTVEIRWIIVQIEYIPINFIGVAFYLFSYAYSKDKLPNRNMLMLNMLVPSLLYISLLTNPLHHYFFKEFRIDGEINEFFCYMTMMVQFSYLLAGAVQFVLGMRNRNIIHKKQSIYFAIATAIPVVAHILLVTGILEFGFLITLVVVPFSMLLFTISVLKFQFLDASPTAIEHTIDSMMEGMLIVENSGEIIDMNIKFFKKILDIEVVFSFQNVDEFMGFLSLYEVEEDSLQKMKTYSKKDFNELCHEKFTIQVENKQVEVSYHVKPMYDNNNKKVATFLTFYDVSKTYELYEELEKRNTELKKANMQLREIRDSENLLEIEKEKNQLMKEVHATLGHSMTELLKMIEALEIVFYSPTVDIKKRLGETLIQSKRTMKEIRAAVTKYRNMGG